MAAAADNPNPNPQLPPPFMADPIIPLNYPVTTKINHTNYLTWKSQIQPIIHGFNLTRFLEEPPPEQFLPTEDGVLAPNPQFALWYRQDQLILG
jgi:hypothetical protein